MSPQTEKKKSAMAKTCTAICEDKGFQTFIFLLILFIGIQVHLKCDL
jgi:hypothetical protein